MSQSRSLIRAMNCSMLPSSTPQQTYQGKTKPQTCPNDSIGISPRNCFSLLPDNVMCWNKGEGLGVGGSIPCSFFCWRTMQWSRRDNTLWLFVDSIQVKQKFLPWEGPWDSEKNTAIQIYVLFCCIWFSSIPSHVCINPCGLNDCGCAWFSNKLQNVRWLH